MRTLDISENLFIHYSANEEVKHYYGVLAIYALLQTAEEKNHPFLIEKAIKVLSRFPNQIDHPHYNFPSYKVGGIARAYALYKKIMCDSETKELVRHYANEMLNDAPKNAKGILILPAQDFGDRTWVDVITAATPYMLFAGLALNCKEYIDFAVRQCFLMYDDLIDDTGLFNQCRGFVSVGVKSKDHWGRGNGWGYLGLTELVKHLPKDHWAYEEAVGRFLDLSQNLLNYQSKQGAWRQEITEPMAYIESSGTGLILYGYGTGIRLGLLEKEKYMGAYEKGLEIVVKKFINTDFSTENSCPGCLCPGTDEDRGTIRAYISENIPYRDEHHSFAPLMLTLVEAHRMGKTDMVIKK